MKDIQTGAHLNTRSHDFTNPIVKWQAVADLRGMGGCPQRMPPLRPKIFSISCGFFGKFWQNCRLAQPLTWNPGSAPGKK